MVAVVAIVTMRRHRLRVLEPTAADELVALENMGVLQQHGFEVAVKEDRPVGQCRRPTAGCVRKKSLQQITLAFQKADWEYGNTANGKC